MLENIKKIHFVGIGGAGMSAIAKILLERGLQVSGSDLNQSDTTEKLAKMGAEIFHGHSCENIAGADAIVVSTAIPATNPELTAARESGITVFHRSDIVAALMSERRGIAVAGAHGKTTTTSMIALILEKSGIDPTVIIGGELNYFGGNAKLGAGKYLVAEADESDGSFLKLTPQIAVVTNIENDHMDHYKTMDNILKAFRQFLLKVPDNGGTAVLCFDNGNIRDIAASLAKPCISYAIDHEADLTAHNIRTHGAQTVYDVYKSGEIMGTVKLNVPGRHNVANSLAAIAVGLNVGISFGEIADGLSLFQGAKRRFQTKARLGGIWIVDDYAHHPTEILSTLTAARQTEPKRLICVFQPHRFSRTKLLQQEFGSAFLPADRLILTDIYGAGEKPIPGITGEVIKEEVERQTGNKVTYIQDKAKIARYLSEIGEPGDLIITMGAGNIYQVGEELIEIMVNK